MVLIAVALVLGAAAGRLLPPGPAHLARLHARHWWLLPLGLGVQVAANRLEGDAGAALLIASFVCLLAFAASNLHLTGMGVLAIGLALNAAPITLNRGMPVRPAALVAADLTRPAALAELGLTRHRHLERPSDRLTVLDDRIPIAAAGQVVSFGDLVVAVGLADVVAHLSRRRRRRVLIDLRQPVATTARPVHDWGTAPRPVPSSGSQYSARPETSAPSARPLVSAPASPSR